MANNSFTGAVMRFSNRGIHTMLAEIMNFRKQLTKRTLQDFKTQSGWDNATNKWMFNCLQRIGDTLENITYNPSKKTIEERELDAADTKASLRDDTTDEDLMIDEVVYPVVNPYDVDYILDGSDLDIPQLTPTSCPNDFARIFIKGLDEIFVVLTRLDSAHAPFQITKNESVTVRALLGALVTILNRKGGEDNRVDIPSGVLNKDEPATFGFGNK